MGGFPKKIKLKPQNSGDNETSLSVIKEKPRPDSKQPSYLMPGESKKERPTSIQSSRRPTSN